MYVIVRFELGSFFCFLPGAKIVAPNYRPRLKFFFIFYSRKSVLDLRLFPPAYQIAKIIAPIIKISSVLS